MVIFLLTKLLVDHNVQLSVVNIWLRGSSTSPLEIGHRRAGPAALLLSVENRKLQHFGAASNNLGRKLLLAALSESAESPLASWGLLIMLSCPALAAVYSCQNT